MVPAPTNCRNFYKKPSPPDNGKLGAWGQGGRLPSGSWAPCPRVNLATHGTLTIWRIMLMSLSLQIVHELRSWKLELPIPALAFADRLFRVLASSYASLHLATRQFHLSG